MDKAGYIDKWTSNCRRLLLLILLYFKIRHVVVNYGVCAKLCQTQFYETIISDQACSSDTSVQTKISDIAGITLAVFGGLYIILGIAELCLPHFPTAGAILYIPIVLWLAAAFGILAGEYIMIKLKSIWFSLQCSIWTCVGANIQSI